MAHRKFADKRRLGEWFDVDMQDVVRAIETFAEVIGKTLIPFSQLQIEGAKRGKGGE